METEDLKSASMTDEHTQLDGKREDDQESDSSLIPTAPTQKPLWPILILVMLGIASFVGFRISRSVQSTPPETPELAQPAENRLPVKVVAAQLSPIQRWVTSPEGEVWVERYKQLIFETAGEITYLGRINGRYLREGDLVKQGQLLATIDDREYNSNIRATKAEVEISRRNQAQANSSLVQAKANLEQALADLELAKIEAKRRQYLFEEGAIAATDRDVYDNRVLQAEVAVKVAKANVKSAEDQILSSRASLEASQAQLTNTVIAKEDTRLVSPIDGMIAYLNIREGEYWSPQRIQTVSSYQDAIESIPIVIVDPNSFEVILELPASEGSLIKPNQLAYIALDSDISEAFVQGLDQNTLLSVAKAKGTVFSVTPAVTPGGRAVQVRIRITSGLENLRLGERVQTWIAAESKADAITLPFGAMITRDRKSYVFVVNEQTQTVEQRPVIRDIEGLDRISIASGLRPGELVVTEGSNRLVDSTPIEVIRD